MHQVRARSRLGVTGWSTTPGGNPRAQWNDRTVYYDDGSVRRTRVAKHPKLSRARETGCQFGGHNSTKRESPDQSVHRRRSVPRGEHRWPLLFPYQASPETPGSRPCFQVMGPERPAFQHDDRLPRIAGRGTIKKVRGALPDDDYGSIPHVLSKVTSAAFGLKRDRLESGSQRARCQPT